ncbi:hypothetical protein AD16_5421 [Escherichia coli 3-267-03_S4_C2]|nr:hypothetical protein AD16_5421 [Escherichia coli 3-267-03_S4_C2]
MKTPTIPTLLGPDGMTSLREYAGYHGGGSGFGGQLRAWNPPGESVDAALLPNFVNAKIIGRFSPFLMSAIGH